MAKKIFKKYYAKRRNQQKKNETFKWLKTMKSSDIEKEKKKNYYAWNVFESRQKAKQKKNWK